MPFLFFLLWLWRMEMLCFPNLLHVAGFLHNLQPPLTQNRGKIWKCVLLQIARVHFH